MRCCCVQVSSRCRPFAYISNVSWWLHQGNPLQAVYSMSWQAASDRSARARDGARDSCSPMQLSASHLLSQVQPRLAHPHSHADANADGKCEVDASVGQYASRGKLAVARLRPPENASMHTRRSGHLMASSDACPLTRQHTSASSEARERRQEFHFA